MKASSSISRTAEPDSHRNFSNDVALAKQHLPIASICRSRVIVPSIRKDRTSLIPLKSKRSPSTTRNRLFPSSTSNSRESKAEPSTSTTDAGRIIPLSEPHCSKANSPIVVSLEPGSNRTSASDLHPAKQRLPSVSTEAGMQTDTSAETWENASSSMQVSVDPGSNVTLDRTSQPEKQPPQMRWN
jgi:hypothetical protein